MAVLPNLAQENANLAAKLAEMEAQIAALKAQSARRITMKVTDKGGLSVYGLGRFPITLYRSQWERLLAEADAISAFLLANSALLSTKD